MNALFAYGTLLFPEVLRAVTGRELPSVGATLDRFVRRRVIGELFPAIVAAGVNERVEGVLYLGLDLLDWRRLDLFEGDLYQRLGVVVRCAAVESTVAPAPRRDGVAGTREAQVYVLHDRWRHRLDDVPWEPEAFARDHLAAFAARLGRASQPRARSDD